MDGSADRDRISQLPHFILHNIISLLEPKDAFSAACLSKSWLELWFTRPDLTFRFHPGNCGYRAENEKIEKLLENTISRLSKSELAVHSLRIKLREYYNNELPFTAVTRLIRFAVENHVKILRIKSRSYCILPETIFDKIFAANSLIEIELCNCHFQCMMFSSVTKCDQFNNLKRLIFDEVCLSGDLEFDKLFCNVPSIEDIELLGCDLGFEKLRISNVPKLKRFKMHYMYGCKINSVEIVAPTLESFDYLDIYLHEGTLNIDACQNLKRLVMEVNFHIDLKSFNSFSNFMCLEFLEIAYSTGYMNSNYNILSQSLKHVRIVKHLYYIISDLRIDAEVMIDAPNLLLFEYVGDSCNSITFKNPPKQLKVTLAVPYVVDNEYPLPAWFLRVRSSLMKHANRTKIYLSLLSPDTDECFVSIKDSEELPKPEVEHVELYFPMYHDGDYSDDDEIESFNARCEAHTTVDEGCFKLKWSA